MRKLLKLLNYLPSKRRAQMVIVSLGLILSSTSKALLVMGVGPLLMVLTGDNDTINSDVSSFEHLLVPLQNHPIFACLLFGFFAVLAGVAGLFSSWAIGRYTNCISLDLLRYSLRSALNEPFIYHASRNSNHTISDISNIQYLGSSVFAPIIQLLGASLTIISTLVVALLVNWRATLISILLGGGIYLSTAARTKALLKRDGSILVENKRQLLVILREAFIGIREVILDGKHKDILAAQEEVSSRSLATTVRAGLTQAMPRYLLESTGYLLLSAFGLFTVLSGKNASFNLATIGTLALAIQNLLPSMQQVFSCWTSFTSSQPMLDLVLSLLDSREKQTHSDKTWPANISTNDSKKESERKFLFKKAIKLNAAYYSHKSFGDQGIKRSSIGLENIELEISKADVFGITGKTGCGKSTLLDILMGLLPLDCGDLLIDQKSLYKSANIRRWWMSQISHVPQQIFLSDASIVKNVTDKSDRQSVNWGKLEWACEQAQAIDFIMSLPDRWDCLIGEDGSRLSGGQRQRLGLARALYRQRPVLILDESTSALDQQTESMVMEGIMKLKNKPTIIMVAHKMSTLEHCNSVILLEQGQIIKSGNLSEIQSIMSNSLGTKKITPCNLQSDELGQ